MAPRGAIFSNLPAFCPLQAARELHALSLPQVALQYSKLSAKLHYNQYSSLGGSLVIYTALGLIYMYSHFIVKTVVKTLTSLTTPSHIHYSLLLLSIWIYGA